MSGSTPFDAADLSRAIHRRELSCREVMQQHLDHIDRTNPAANAIISLRPRDDLLAEADRRDQQLARGHSLGWMHGFPHAVKDLARTAGLRTTFGSPLFADHVPTEDAIIVERIRAAGAILIGKTNTPEWGLGSHTYNPVSGTTLNPYDPTRSAGGSSGGAAVALAHRMLPVADGSDFGGSLRNPAAWSNVIGVRPSRGRVPSNANPELFAQQFSTDGPMARTVTDAALLLSILAGHDHRAPLSLPGDGGAFARPLAADMRGRRIGWLGGLADQLPFEPGILDLCRTALAAFETIGCTVDAAEFAFPRARLWDTFVTLRAWSLAGSLGPLHADPARRPHLKPAVVWEVETGLRLSAADIYAASLARSDLYRAVDTLFDRFDALVLPSAQCFPFDATIDWPRSIAGVAMDTYHRWMEVVIMPTLCGCPVAAIPAGFGRNGLPMGIQLIGRPGADLPLLQLAHAYDQATNWGPPTPAARIDACRNPATPRSLPQ